MFSPSTGCQQIRFRMPSLRVCAQNCRTSCGVLNRPAPRKRRHHQSEDEKHSHDPQSQLPGHHARPAIDTLASAPCSRFGLDFMAEGGPIQMPASPSRSAAGAPFPCSHLIGCGNVGNARLPAFPFAAGTRGNGGNGHSATRQTKPSTIRIRPLF
jgi:hypothetical protein